MEVPHFGKKSWVYCKLVTLGTLQTFWVCHYYPDWVCCNLFTKTEEAGVNGLWTELKRYFSTLAARLQRRRWSLWKVSESVLKSWKIVLNQFWTRSCKMAGGIECLKRIWSDKKMWWWKKTHVLGLFTLNTHGPNPESKFFSKSF